MTLHLSAKPRTLVLLSGLTYVPSAILTPIVTNYQLRRSGMADKERQLLVKNETMRQIVSASIHFVTYYGGVLLAGSLLKNKNAEKPVLELLSGIFFSTIGHGIFRPILTNTLLVRWLNNDPASLPIQKPPAPQPVFQPFIPQRAVRPAAPAVNFPPRLSVTA